MTSDAQMPLAHAAMLSDTYGGTYGFQEMGINGGRSQLEMGGT